MSLLQPDGAPSPVQRVLIKPPGSRVGPISDGERAVLVSSDAVGIEIRPGDRPRVGRGETGRARERRRRRLPTRSKRKRRRRRRTAAQAKLDIAAQRQAEREEAQRRREAAKPTMADKMLQSAGRAVASSVGRQIATRLLRGLLGGMSRGR